MEFGFFIDEHSVITACRSSPFKDANDFIA